MQTILPILSSTDIISPAKTETQIAQKTSYTEGKEAFGGYSMLRHGHMQKMQDVLIKHNLLCLNGIKMGFTNCRLNMQNIHYLVFLVLFLYFGKNYYLFCRQWTLSLHFHWWVVSFKMYCSIFIPSYPIWKMLALNRLFSQKWLDLLVERNPIWMNLTTKNKFIAVFRNPVP